LWTGEPARDSWRKWQARVENPLQEIKDDAKGYKRLLPLLYAALKRNGISADPFLMTCLRTSRLREEIRAESYFRTCGEVLSALQQCHIRAIPLKGAALALGVYDHPGLRHCHDIDILVDEADPYDVSERLAPLGFEIWQSRMSEHWEDLKFKHRSGLPLEIHRRLFDAPSYDIPFQELWQSTKPLPISKIRSRALSPTHSLLQVCSNAFFCNGRASLSWVCDAWLVMDRNSDLEWQELIKLADRNDLAPALSITLGYLSDAFAAAVPNEYLVRLGGFSQRH
jgi:hypothetical protein